MKKTIILQKKNKKRKLLKKLLTHLKSFVNIFVDLLMFHKLVFLNKINVKM